MCYPDSVLFHVHLRGLTEDHLQALVDAPGFTCRAGDDATAIVSIRFAHDVPSQPDAEALERRLRLALQALVPGAEITDVRYGFRHSREPVSPALVALHRLRQHLGRLDGPAEPDSEGLAQTLQAVSEEFARLDDWLCNGGSLPSEWARRHPGGDEQAARQVEQARQPAAAMAG